MRLFENPLFVTHLRLTRRTGMLAPVLIALLVGTSLLAGLVAALIDPVGFHVTSPEDAGKTFYGWIVGVELLVLVVGGFGHIWRALADDRRIGLLDSNRMTPQRPRDLVLGYLCGAPLREFMMGAVLAACGLPIVVLAKLPFTLWFISQLLIATTTAFFWLLAVLTGFTLDRPFTLILLLVLMLIAQSVTVTSPELFVTGQILPLNAIIDLFPTQDLNSPWHKVSTLFGVSVHSTLITWALQLAVGALLWRATIRRTVNPSTSALSRWEVLALVGLLVGTQHALIWGPQGLGPHGAIACLADDRSERHMMLACAQGAALFLGLFILALLSPTPERVRIDVLRGTRGSLGIVYSQSSIVLAIQLAAVCSLLLGIQFATCLASTWKVYATCVLNTGNLFMILALWLDLCRMQFRRRALGFFALGMFVLGIIPYILAGVFSNETLAKWSLLSPGIWALSQTNDYLNEGLFHIAIAQLGIVVLLFVVWRNRWANRLRQGETLDRRNLAS